MLWIVREIGEQYMQQIRVIAVQYGRVSFIFLDKLDCELELILKHCPVKDWMLLLVGLW